MRRTIVESTAWVSILDEMLKLRREGYIAAVHADDMIVTVHLHNGDTITAIGPREYRGLLNRCRKEAPRSV
jgi:hypothetical protein